MRRARARLEIIISREVILVVRLPPLGNTVVEGVVAIPVESVVVIVAVVVVVRLARSEAHLDRRVPVVAWHVSTNEVKPFPPFTAAAALALSENVMCMIR